MAVKKKVSREPSYDRNSQVDRMSCEELAMFLASLASIPNMIIFLNIHLYYYYHCLSPNFQIWWRTITLARTHSISGHLESWNWHVWLKNDGEKWSRVFCFEIHHCCCLVQKNLPRRAELARQVSLKGLGELQKKKL